VGTGTEKSPERQFRVHLLRIKSLAWTPGISDSPKILVMLQELVRDPCIFAIPTRSGTVVLTRSVFQEPDHLFNRFGISW
jgi:hypothetical protein